MTVPILIRPAQPADADAVADIYLAARRRFLPYAPIAHSEADVRAWIAGHLIAFGGVWVAEERGAALGMLALAEDEQARWIDQLYVRPDRVGGGVGTLLLRHALDRLAAPVRLYTFQANAGARRFYERHGFQAVAFGDGSGNEERCPDVLYEWRGA